MRSIGVAAGGGDLSTVSVVSLSPELVPLHEIPCRRRISSWKGKHDRNDPTRDSHPPRRWTYLHFPKKVIRYRPTVDLGHTLNDHFRLVYSVFTEKPSRRLGNDPIVAEEENERYRGGQRQREPMPEQVTLRKRRKTGYARLFPDQTIRDRIERYCVTSKARRDIADAKNMLITMPANVLYLGPISSRAEIEIEISFPLRSARLLLPVRLPNMKGI